MMKESFAFSKRVSFEEARVALLPVPWDATASQGRGAASAPLCVKNSSHYLDFFTRDYGAYNHLLYFFEEEPRIRRLNQEAARSALEVINSFEEGRPLSPSEQAAALKVNQASQEMALWVQKESGRLLAAGKIPGLVGGDHSISEGLIHALRESHDFGVLHIDAHMDLRESYQGFSRSHASIMRRVISSSSQPLVQAGVRDFSQEEWEFSQSRASQVKVYFDEDLKKRAFQGESWLKICQEIVSHLPEKIYISLDVDGLEWSLSPHTGAPVPGGLSYWQLAFLLKEAGRKKQILGFDVVEAVCAEAAGGAGAAAAAPGSAAADSGCASSFGAAAAGLRGLASAGRHSPQGRLSLWRRFLAKKPGQAALSLPSAPHTCWSGNVAARLIYLLCGACLLAQRQLV